MVEEEKQKGEEGTRQEAQGEQPPSDSELFAGNVTEELSEQEIFAGDDNLYKMLDSSANAEKPKAAAKIKYTDTSQPAPVQIGSRHLPVIQSVLAFAILSIAAMLLYLLLKSPIGPLADIKALARHEEDSVVPGTPPSVPSGMPYGSVHKRTYGERTAYSVEEKTLDAAHPTLNASKGTRHETLHRTPDGGGISDGEEGTSIAHHASQLIQPVSLKIAETFYLQKDYENAYNAFNRLRINLPDPMASQDSQVEVLADFLGLRMAMCIKQMASDQSLQQASIDNADDEADRLFRILANSRSPAVRMVANYQLAFSHVQRKQYLKACSRAYQVIALIGATNLTRQQALTLQRDCHFLIAACISRNVLALLDNDIHIPPKLWTSSRHLDPFAGLNQQQLVSCLNSGIDELTKALLSPQIKNLDPKSTSPHWSVTSFGASIEEVLSRFSANAGFELNWPATDSSIDIKKRPVTLYMPSTVSQQFITTAAGCAALMTLSDKKNVVNIYNPQEYASLSQHTSTLNRQAVSLWQQFLVLYHSDKRLANAHFALGMLQAQKNQPEAAIAEYKLVANRFADTPMAPYALLHSSQLKISLRDYTGARGDLKQLTEQYPDSQIAGRSYLYLADATYKASLKTEAARSYCKVYHLGLSEESKTAAAFSAGKCFYENGQFSEAEKWFNRYIELAELSTDDQLSLAYLLLGKTNLAVGNPHQACECFRRALDGQPAETEFLETIKSLVKGYAEQNDFLEALDLLESLPDVGLSKKASLEILLLKSACLREMSLPDSALSLIGDRAQYVFDTELKARLYFESARCYIAKKDLESAREHLLEILTFVEAGQLSHQVTVELAEVCSKLGRDNQAISICSQLLELNPSETIRQKALGLMVDAYKRQKKYDKAASVLLGYYDTSKSNS